MTLSKSEIIQQLDAAASIPEAFLKILAKLPDQTVFRQSGKEFSRQQVLNAVSFVRERLQQAGMKLGDRVAIISNTRPEWLIADLAIQSLGGVTVSIYQTLTPEDVAYILYDSDARFVIAENQEQVDKLAFLAAQNVAIPAVEDRAGHDLRLKFNHIFTFESVSSELSCEQLVLEQIINIAPGELELPSMSREQLAALVYTSGTTGPAKGVMQTHGNHLANVRQAVRSGLVEDFPPLMLFLPLAHSFARLMGYLGVLTPVSLCFASVADRRTSKVDLNQVTRDIQAANAAILPLVPRVLEKMQSAVIEHTSKPGLKNSLVRLAIRNARRIWEIKSAGQFPGVIDRFIFEGLTPLRNIIKKQLFGQQFRYVVSGGAKLNTEVAKFFESLGIAVLEGYGLTETCVATNINPVGRNKIGTVGPVLDTDIELSLSAEGEILYRGPNITKGYLNRPQATAGSWDADGWFHTGDLGKLDGDGYLSIVGRKKEIIVNSYGKNISCLNVEQHLTNSEFISQAILIGEARPYCVALLVPDWQRLKRWSEAHSKNVNNLQDADVVKLFETEIARVNEQLASFEEVKKFVLLAEEFSIENGLLTPTLKIKRSLVEKSYADQIAKMYQ
jgi:long-chain acyl-CoA synthetase